MSTFALKTILKAAAVTPTPLHDGTNGDPLGGRPTVPGFIVEADGASVFLGGSDVADQDNGFEVCDGERMAFTGFPSRGSYQDYQLTQIYYVGGPLRLTVEIEAKE